MLIEANGIELYYEIHGEGAPLIMVNGFGSSSEMWSPFWKKLTDS